MRLYCALPTITLLVLAHTLGTSTEAAAQDTPPIAVGERVSVLGQLWGPEVLGAYLNFYLSDHISVNVGAGVNSDAHIGANTYLMNRNGSAHALYVGVQLVRSRPEIGF